MSNHRTGINLPPTPSEPDANQWAFAAGMEARYAGRLPEFESAGWTVRSHSVDSPQYIGTYQTACITKLDLPDGVEVWITTNDRNDRVDVTVALEGFAGSHRAHFPQTSKAATVGSARFHAEFISACVAEAAEEVAQEETSATIRRMARAARISK